MTLIKVYLSKKDVKTNSLSDISNQYEGKINKEDCDIVFEFNEDWSNAPELEEVILKNVFT